MNPLGMRRRFDKEIELIAAAIREVEELTLRTLTPEEVMEKITKPMKEISEPVTINDMRNILSENFNIVY